jgi:glycosyltransferase involved in cell wall biosynthesis
MHEFLTTVRVQHLERFQPDSMYHGSRVVFHSLKAMRILYDHQVFSLQDTGGISRYHYELIRNLQFLEGVRIEALLGGNASVLPFTHLRDARTRITAWKTSIAPSYARYAINEALLSLVVPLRGTFDVYHPTLNRIMPSVRRRRIVVTQHDCTHERFPHLFRNPDAFLRTKRKILSQADAILCVSESSRRDLLHFYDLDETKTHVVYHGFSPLQEGPPAEPRSPAPVDPYLLYVGSRTEYKNFMLLLEAFALSGLAAEYHLIAVGGGPPSTQELARVSQLGVTGRVRLVPRANDQTLAGLYRNASLFVYPSLYEGFGFPPLEAMSLGCPVLANDTSSLPEICGEAAFYFSSQEAVDLAKSLAAVLADASGLNQKRKLGYERVRLYDWSRTARRTLQVYAGCAPG